MLANINEIEDRLWNMADGLRANTHLRSSEYSLPVLGLIFLRFADEKFQQVDQELRSTITPGSRYELSPSSYKARRIIYLPVESRYDYLLHLSEDADLGDAINQAMRAIEEYNEDLQGSLPTSAYTRLDKRTLKNLLRAFDSVPFAIDIEEDPFGRIYEYFLSKFALQEGQRGGEFFTPTSIVQLIVEVIEPFHRKLLDRACGSGGMFVQSAKFVQKRRQSDFIHEVSIYGQEKSLGTVQLCKMNLAVHGLPGDIKDANSYYEDPHNSVGRFDFIMANPPFNVNGVDKQRIKNDTRHFPFGIPRVDNANYLWI